MDIFWPMAERIAGTASAVFIRSRIVHYIYYLEDVGVTFWHHYCLSCCGCELINDLIVCLICNLVVSLCSTGWRNLAVSVSFLTAFLSPFREQYMHQGLLRTPLSKCPLLKWIFFCWVDQIMLPRANFCTLKRFDKE